MASAAFGFRSLHLADAPDRIYWRGSVFMAMALAGYLGTMMAALVAFMMLWNSIIGPPTLERVRQQPHPVVAIAQDSQDSPVQVAPAAKQPGPWGPAVVHGADEASNAVEDARLAAAKDAAVEKTKRLKQARNQKRKEQLARQRQDQDQQFSTALGYDQQPPQDVSSASIFGPFGPRRFSTR
jgi:hypothetical protein